MEGSERPGDAFGHAGLAERRVRHGRSVEELDHRRATVREVVEHGRADAQGRRHAGAVELARAVDRQELGGCARDPDDERLAVDVHPVVRVREPVRERPDGDRLPAPGLDAVDDLLDGDGGVGGHASGGARPDTILAQARGGRAWSRQGNRALRHH